MSDTKFGTEVEDRTEVVGVPRGDEPVVRPDDHCVDTEAGNVLAVDASEVIVGQDLDHERLLVRK
jgi:hypothetical protein